MQYICINSVLYANITYCLSLEVLTFCFTTQRCQEQWSFQVSAFKQASFLPGAVHPDSSWINANQALAQGRRVPFFLIKDYTKQLGLIKNAIPVKTLVDSLIETENYVRAQPVSSPPSKRAKVEGTRGAAASPLLQDFEDDDLPGVTHRVQHWIKGDDEKPFVQLDKEESWKRTPAGRLRQAELLRSFKEDASRPAARFSPQGGEKSVFLPLLHSVNHLRDPAVPNNWRELAAEVETRASDVLRGLSLLPEDFVTWTDVIKNAGAGGGILPSHYISDGFGSQRPEIFVKSGLCVTLEHHEHMGSSSINIFPPQRPAEELQEGSGSPPSRNLWRGWLLSDLERKLKDAKFVPEKEKFTRASFHNYYCDHWAGKDLELSKFLVEVLKVPTFFVIQEEGDMVVTTQYGSHDVIYAGGPSYQVAWNFGFSKSEALALLDAFNYDAPLDSTGNDASTTPHVLRNFLCYCWPGKRKFLELHPEYKNLMEKVSRTL